MNEVFTAAEKLHATPALFPWVCLGVICLVIFWNRELIKNYINATITEKRETTLYHAQNNELIRNNTAALNNNTAALEMVKRDRDITMQFLQHHEQLSSERFDHLQRVANQTRDIVIENQKEIIVANERLND